MRTRPIFRVRGYRRCSKLIKRLERRLAHVEGRSVAVRFLPALTADRRRLYSESPHGQPVHAGSFIRKREIVLDRELADRPRELARILAHEFFHFVWVRLGNPRRRSFEALLRAEWKERARGELGWSAESRKRGLAKNSSRFAQSRVWREYVCESFCDTGAWVFSGVRRHPEYTLAARHCDRRADWFRATYEHRAIAI